MKRKINIFICQPKTITNYLLYHSISISIFDEQIKSIKKLKLQNKWISNIFLFKKYLNFKWKNIEMNVNRVGLIILKFCLFTCLDLDYKINNNNNAINSDDFQFLNVYFIKKLHSVKWYLLIFKAFSKFQLWNFFFLFIF